MKMNITCRRLCPDKQYNRKELALLKSRIEDNHRGCPHCQGTSLVEFLFTTPLKVKTTLINIHLFFTIKYHQPKGIATEKGMTPSSSNVCSTSSLLCAGFRIVGFTVVPYSIKHPECTCVDDDSKNAVCQIPHKERTFWFVGFIERGSMLTIVGNMLPWRIPT